MNISGSKSQSQSSKKEDEQESIYGKLIKQGLAAATTNAAIGAVAEGITAGDLPDDGQVISKAPEYAGDVISGPAEGGGFVDRPIAGAMSEAALEQSLELEYGQDGSVSATEGQGNIVVNGYEINIPDYVPGSDIAKLAAGGSLDAGDGLSMLIEQGIGAGARNAMNSSGSDSDDSKDDESSSSTSSSSGGDDGRLSERAIGADGTGGSQVYSTNSEGILETPENKEKRDEIVREEVQIEKEALEIEHRAELREGLRTQDLGAAVTERQGKHGSLRLETQFEARHPDNKHEIDKGEDHLTDVMRSPRNATRSDTDQIHLFTILQEQENDKGISRF